MSKSHAPKDVYETREDYRCGVCHQPVVRYSAPRARWVHGEQEPEPQWITPDSPRAPYCVWCSFDGHTYKDCPDRT